VQFRDDRPFIVGLTGVVSVFVPVGVVAALGVVCVVLGPGWELGVFLRSWWWSRPVDTGGSTQQDDG